MAFTDRTPRATRRPRPISRLRAMACPALLAAVAISGCAPAGSLRWLGAAPEAAGEHDRQRGLDFPAGGPDGTEKVDRSLVRAAVAGPGDAPGFWVPLALPVRLTGGLAGGEAPSTTDSVRKSTGRASGTQYTPPPFIRKSDSRIAEKVDRSLVRAATAGPGDAPVGLPPSIAPPAAVMADLPPAVPPADRGEFPIDLTTALRLAEVENPAIAEARVRVVEALAVQQGARALLLPTLNAGFNYHGHAGNLQRSSGRILNLAEQSLYLGGGTGAIAASTTGVPAVNIVSELTDALFRPLTARQQVVGARFQVSATANQVLLEVTELHFDLLAAVAELQFRRETARQAAEVARLTDAYAKTKLGRPADAARAATELRLIERAIRQTEETVAVTSTRLVQRLHLDPTVRIQPVAPGIETITLIDPDASLQGLVDVAIRQRPEVGASNAAVAAAEARHRQEQFRPLLPTLFVGFSGGGFGGGSNLAPPELGNFRGRTDFDVGVFWTLRNFGAGNAALMKRRRAEVGEAVGERSRAVAEVRSEVAAAHAEAAAARRRVDITAAQLRSAEAGFQEDLDRIRNVVGRPVEVVNSLRLLNDARVARVRAVTDANKAEFRLFVSLGSPPPLARPATDPLPPAPIAWPPVGPVGERPGA
jgi:outer membrane protein TolC